MTKLASFASQDTLERLIGLPRGPVAGPTGTRVVARPVAEKVSDPRTVIDDILEIVEGDAPPRRPPNAWLSGRRGPVVDIRFGQGRVDGRACCFETLTELDARLALLRLPHEVTCGGCGAVYRIAQQLAPLRR